MARKRKDKNSDWLAVRRVGAKKFGRAADSGTENGEPHLAQCVIEFPKPATSDDVVSNRIVFHVGGDQFAIQWTAQIEQLPPAGPVVVARKQLAEIGPFVARKAAAIEAGIQNGRRSKSGTKPVRVKEQKGAGE